MTSHTLPFHALAPSGQTVADQRMARLAAEPLISVGPPKGALRGALHSLKDLQNYRELMGLLVRRELKARYKDSVLGFLWTLIRPLTMLLVYYVAMGKFLGAERSIPDFAIYIFTGLTAWQFFNEIISAGTASIVGNAGLVKKVYLPREVFPLSVVGSALVTLATQLVVLAAAVVISGHIPTGSRLLYAPLALLVLLVYATALALVLAAINVYLRDVQYLVEISLTVLFWLTPVCYSWRLVGTAVHSDLIQQIYLANPLTIAVMAMQRGLWAAGSNQPVPPDLGTRLLVMLAVGLLLVWGAQRVFARFSANFAQEL